MARPKSTGEIKSHQQHLLITPSEVKAIDDWRFANRIGSRAEAIRNLCAMGLQLDGQFDHLWDLSKEVHLSSIELEMAALKLKADGKLTSLAELEPHIEAMSVDAARVGEALRALVKTAETFRQGTFDAALRELAAAEKERDTYREKYEDVLKLQSKE